MKEADTDVDADADDDDEKRDKEKGLTSSHMLCTSSSPHVLAS